MIVSVGGTGPSPAYSASMIASALVLPASERILFASENAGSATSSRLTADNPMSARSLLWGASGSPASWCALGFARAGLVTVFRAGLARDAFCFAAGRFLGGL